MPNQPKTPMHAFRCDDELWDDAKAAAAVRGETLADVLRRSLRDYVEDVRETEKRRKKRT